MNVVPTLPRIQVIVASVRDGRVGRAVADWFVSIANAHGGFSVEIIDLIDHPLPHFDEPHHPRTGKYLRDTTQAWSRTISRADGFVFVTPEYNHSLPGALKNAIDHLNAEWVGKPAGFVSYGGVSAGTRAVEALIPVLACFEMPLIMKQVNLPFVATAMQAGQFTPPAMQDDAARAMLNALLSALEIKHSRV